MSKADEASAESVKAPPKACTGKVSFQGFQVLAAQDADDANESSSISFQMELEARAERFREAVDESIVLSNDGVIRWLGDPVAKISAGPDLYAPGVLILADSCLSEASTDLVVKRLDLWISGLINRLLGPLISLRDLNEEPDSVRQVGRRISDALGMLPRELIRHEVKALDQSARSALRKQGVRFGAYHVYVPTTLKPASRALALQLWGLRSNRGDSTVIVQTLGSLAASGRTSLPFDANLGVEAYRAAGFRLCGDRVVRADIVERLADLIRATFSPPTPAAERSGFQITTQMTSLTGCSGGDFASILRSLGFESQEVKHSDPHRRGERGKAPPPSSIHDNVHLAGQSLDGGTVGEAKCESPLELLGPSRLNEEATPVAGDSTKEGDVLSEGLKINADSDHRVVIWRPVRRSRYRSPVRKARSVDGAVELLASQDDGSPASDQYRKLSLPCQQADAGAYSKKQGNSIQSRGERSSAADERVSDANLLPRSFDANSPFAKLAELRTLLLQSDKRRR